VKASELMAFVFSDPSIIIRC